MVEGFDGGSFARLHRIEFGKFKKARNRYMKAYRIVDRSNSQLLRDFLANNRQVLLPMVKLIDGSRMASGELVDVLGPARTARFPWWV